VAPGFQLCTQARQPALTGVGGWRIVSHHAANQTLSFRPGYLISAAFRFSEYISLGNHFPTSTRYTLAPPKSWIPFVDPGAVPLLVLTRHQRE
jgi:hypothetical protein